MLKIFLLLGNYFPLFLVAFSIIFLLLNKMPLVPILIFVGLNYLLNIILKITIKQDRPQKKQKKRKNQKWYNHYGMPSTHCQVAAFHCALLMPMMDITPLIFFLLITMWQRLYINAHTIWQVIAGVAVGFLFGIGVNKFLKHE